MKRLFLLSLFLLSKIWGFAQSDSLQFRHFEKGKNIIGLQFAGGFGAGTVVGQIHLRYGRFLLKKFNAGIETGFGSSGIFYKSIYIRPFGRYYILNKKLSPFVEANYSYGFAKQTNGQTGILMGKRTATINTISALGGLAYTGILKRFGIELYGGYRYSIANIKDHQTNNRYQSNGGRLTYGLRINYHF